MHNLDLQYDLRVQRFLKPSLRLIASEVFKQGTPCYRIKQMMHVTELDINPATWMILLEVRLDSVTLEVRDTVIQVAGEALDHRLGKEDGFMSPLACAVFTRRVEIARRLIDGGADVTEWEKRYDLGFLHCAAQNQDPKMFELLLRAGTNPRYRQIKLETVLYCVLKYNGDAFLKYALYHLEIDINQVCDGNGGNIISAAAKNGYLTASKLRILLKAGADLFAPLSTCKSLFREQSDLNASISPEMWPILRRAASASLILTILTSVACNKSGNVSSPIRKLPKELFREGLKFLVG